MIAQNIEIVGFTRIFDILSMTTD